MVQVVDTSERDVFPSTPLSYTFASTHKPQQLVLDQPYADVCSVRFLGLSTELIDAAYTVQRNKVDTATRI